LLSEGNLSPNKALREIEKNYLQKREALKRNFVQRLIVFSLSGTYLVDMKDIAFSRVSSKLQPDLLTNLLVGLVKTSLKENDDSEANSENFIQVELFQ